MSLLGCQQGSNNLWYLQEYDAALADLALAAEISPEDKSVRAEIARVKRTRDEVQKREKATYARMFS